MLLNRELKPSEIDFVLFHLSHHLEGFHHIRPLLHYGRHRAEGEVVSFLASDEDIDLSRAVVLECIPVLFPISEDVVMYRMEEGRLVYCHDLLKSAFYLLSGYQEWSQPDLADQWQRFPYEASIQCRLGIIHKPMVNYYFEWIIDGLIEFAAFHNLPLQRRMPFGRMGLHLSHDIDLLRYHSSRKVLYRMAQLVGLRPINLPRRRLFHSVVNTLFDKVRIQRAENPYWSFSKILNTERYFGFRSSWFFLPRDGGPFDADYDLHDPDVLDMIQRLVDLEQEIGLHGSIKGASDYAHLSETHENLAQLLGRKPAGIRMHFLSLKYPDTMLEFDQMGISYDCSLGFSKMEGFRFGYCFPFRTYDHDRGRMSSVWEIPLVAMDTTLLEHRRLGYDEVFQQFEILLDEVARFHGVFTLLWHNTTFDEWRHPGIVKFYESLHHYLSQYSPVSLTGEGIVDKMESLR
ncbi:MAG: polysaccharide deacetylase family protein [Breznakibacter sp.]